MDETVLLRVALGEAALVAAALLLLAGHAFFVAARRRRQGSRLAGAAAALAGALRGEAPDRRALDELAGLPAGAQIEVFADVGQSLRGVQKQRLAEVAAEVGLVDRAERWCRSRCWASRLRGARVLTLVGGGESVVPPLLADRSAEVRSQAAQWVADHPGPVSIERLLVMLSDPESLCRFTVKDSLLRLGRASADALLGYISDVDAPPAPEALEVAAGIADARFLGAALELCQASDSRTRVLAATLAGSIGGRRAAGTLTALLRDQNEEVRAAAAKALGRLAHWPAAGALAECLRDPSWDVRRAAAIALRAIGAAGTVLLRRTLKDRDRFARDMARQVLDLPGSERPPANGVRPRGVRQPAQTS